MSPFPILDWRLNSQYSEADGRLYLGRIPLLINPQCADPVWQQVQDNYPAGWQPVMGTDREKWHLMGDDYLRHDGLPPVAPVAMAYHQRERIIVYPAGWIVVVDDSTGEFTVARIEP
jgi:hypothetical protein